MFLIAVHTILRNAHDTAQRHKTESPIPSEVLFLIQDYGYVLSIAAIICVTTLIDIFSEEKQCCKRKIRGALQALHEEYFGTIKSKGKFEHRVTLFRRRRLWCRALLWQGLVIHARKGPNESSRTWFRVHEKEDLNEGIAGRAWYTNAAVTETLPPWPDSHDPSAQQAHAEAGNLPLKKVRALNVKPAAVSASVVRRPNGKKYGVLVVDSRTAGCIQERREKILDKYAQLIGSLV